MSINKQVKQFFGLYEKVDNTPTSLKGYHTETYTRFGRHPAVFLKLTNRLKKLSQII